MSQPDPEFVWEDCACPLCGADADNRSVAYQFPESTYHSCGGCGLVYLSPRLEESSMRRLSLEARHSRGEQDLGRETSEQDAAASRRTFERRLAEMKPWKPRGRVLDVGCGSGLFLEVAIEAGYDAYGLDSSEHVLAGITRGGKRDLASRIHVGRLESADLEPASFDVVTMFDFFEHVYQPTVFVERLAEVLAPGGIAVVATPDYDSWLRRLLGSRTVSVKIPEHVTYYTSTTLAAAVRRRFKIGHVQAIGQYCTTDFAQRQVAAVSPLLARLFGAGVRLAGADAWQPYVPSGSLLAILLRR